MQKIINEPTFICYNNSLQIVKEVNLWLNQKNVL